MHASDELVPRTRAARPKTDTHRGSRRRRAAAHPRLTCSTRLAGGQVRVSVSMGGRAGGPDPPHQWGTVGGPHTATDRPRLASGHVQSARLH